jgi:hypothetical protein
MSEQERSTYEFENKDLEAMTHVHAVVGEAIIGEIKQLRQATERQALAIEKLVEEVRHVKTAVRAVAGKS